MAAHNFELIEYQRDLERFADRHQGISWMCFDTEFVGERRFNTRLCLIQVASEFGFFLIDPFKIEDLGPFLDMIENRSILKIAHAGENDYRLLYNAFGILPKNVFDTQVAAGFVGYKYPISFKRLVEREMDRSVDKGYTIANWESRPFSPKQLRYAINDVVPLQRLYRSLTDKLNELNRYSWAEQECALQEEDTFFYQDPHKEVINNDLMKSLYPRERLFLLRLIMWRTKKAQQKNYSKEMVLPKKYLGHITRGIGSGKDALTNNRRIPRKIIENNWPDFQRMFEEKVKADEQEILDRIPLSKQDDPKKELILDLLYLIVKHKAWTSSIAAELVFPKSWLKTLTSDHLKIAGKLSASWRKELLGDAFIEWIYNFPDLQFHFTGNKLEILTLDGKGATGG